MSIINTLIAMLMLASLGNAGVKHSVDNPSAEACAWVDSIYNTMSDRQRVAQLFVPRLDIKDDEAGRRHLRRMIDAGIGGFLLGNGSVADYAALIQLGQSEARIPLLVTLDGEWGLSMRVPGTPRFPYNMALGAITDESTLYDYGSEVARECRAMGIQVNFAPVLDVNSNPDNPVIGYRSFGESPSRVAALGVAYSRGLESGGVLSVGKHFPGHGDTSTDSHKALPSVNRRRAALDSIDLVPFRSYIKSGMSGVMVGHLCVPALDPSGSPASLSAPITTGLLKGTLGFDGLVFTDALNMKGASSAQNNCVRALLAGADVMLASLSPIEDIEAVCKAVESGVISRDLIDTRCRKMLAYKYALGLGNLPPARPIAKIDSVINSIEAEAVNRKLCAAIITCVYNRDNLLPIGQLDKHRIAVVSIGADADNQFVDYCRKYADCDVVTPHSGGFTAEQLKRLDACDVVIAGVFGDGKGAVASFAALDNVKNLVPVFFLNPYKMKRFSQSLHHHATLVVAFDDTPYLREYAAQALFGGIAMTGRFPVNVAGVASLGEGVNVAKSRLSYGVPSQVGMCDDLPARIDDMVASAMKSGAFPGCQVLVAKDGMVIVDKAYGVTTKGEEGHPVTPSTLYDVASVTKATATLAGIMKAYDEGLIKLDDLVADYVEAVDTLPVGKIPLRKLLTHTSGLPATVSMYRMMMDTATYTPPLTSKKKVAPYTLKIEDGLFGNADARFRSNLVSHRKVAGLDTKIGENLYVGDVTYDSIMARIYSLVPKGNAYKYSDLNFCLLMAVEENVTDEAHDAWVDAMIFKPIGAYNTMYRPSDRLPLSRIAPTENDQYMRRQTVHGYVHDEIAAFSGGVQGNAGLFATAEDIAKLCSMWLNGGTYGPDRLLSEATVSEFLNPANGAGNRGLGFDLMKAPDGTTTLLGHKGFTGTCFWIDPRFDLIYVFLSNRVNPSRSNAAFTCSDIRNRILRAIYDCPGLSVAGNFQSR